MCFFGAKNVSTTQLVQTGADVRYNRSVSAHTHASLNGRKLVVIMTSGTCPRAHHLSTHLRHLHPYTLFTINTWHACATICLLILQGRYYLYILSRLIR